MRASELAKLISGKLLGDDVDIKGVSTLQDAREGDLAFYTNPRYKRMVYETKASCILTWDEGIKDSGKSLIICQDPYSALADVIKVFFKEKPVAPYISPKASIGSGVSIGKGVFIGDFVFVGNGVRLGEGVRIHPLCYIGDGVEIGDGTEVFPHVTIYSGVRIGKRVRIHSGTVVGSDGFGYAPTKRGAKKIPQVGGVIIGDDVEIGSNCSIDRGTLGNTIIGNRVKIDNLVQIAHNVVIGDDSIIVSQVGIAGSARLGKGVILAGQVGVAGHVTVGDGVKAGGQTGITSDVPPGSVVSGTPHMDHRLWLRVSTLLKRLPELFRDVKAIKNRLGGSK